MRDPNRIDTILHDIGVIWHKYPDMRLGQLIGNVLEGAALYYVEDNGLIAALKDSYEGKEEKVDFDIDSYIFSLIKKAPGELGFILQEKTYQDYLATYTDAGGTVDEAAYTEHEFKTLKDYFGDEK